MCAPRIYAAGFFARAVQGLWKVLRTVQSERVVRGSVVSNSQSDAPLNCIQMLLVREIDASDSMREHNFHEKGVHDDC